MMIAVGIGNTNIAAGLFENGFLSEVIRIPTARFDKAEFIGKLRTYKKGCAGYEGSMIASVVPGRTEEVKSALEALTGQPPSVVTAAGDLGMDFTAYDYKRLGADRAVCCAGALAIGPPPFIVIDLGTATTVNVVDESGRFAGGAILPGVRMGLAALAKDTALLPEIDTAGSVPLIGADTKACLLAGAVIGTAGALGAFVGRIGQKMPGAACLITGGNAGVILPHLDFEYRHEPNLLLQGLYHLYKRQQALCAPHSA